MKRRLLIALAILLLAPLLLLGWLMNTESGLRWGYDMALLQLPGEFSAAEVSGSLAGPITLRGVDYQQQGVEVGAARIEVDWDPWELLTLRLHVTRLRIESLRLALPADADSAPARDAPIELPGFVMPIAMQLDGAQIEAIDIRRGESAYRIARIGLRLDAQYNRFEIGELEIEADEFSAHLDGRITAREGYPHAIDFEWHGSLPSGAEFDGKGNLAGDLSSTRLQQQVQGLVQFEHSLEIEDLLAKPHWRLTASTAEIDIRRLDPTLPGIRGTLVATAEGDLETATASGKLTGSEPRIGEFEANFRLRSLDGERRFEGIEVEALDVEALAGSIAAGGRVEWLPATRWTAEVSANGIDPATLFAEWPGKLSARLDTSGGIENGALAARADIGRLEGELRGYPVLASGQVEWLNGDLSIDALKINSGNTRFTADGTVGEALDLAWSLHSENLAEVYPRAGGSLDVEGFLRGSRETPRLEAGIEGASVSFAEIRLGKVAGRVAIDPLQAERFDIDLAAEDVRIGQRQFGRIYVEAGPQSIDAQMTNDLGTTDMVLEGSLDGLAWRGKLASLTIETNEFSNWKLAEPAALYLSIENSSLARSCLLGEQRGRFCSAWSGNQRDWKLENDIEKLPLQLLSNRVPRELNLQEGEITAQTRLQKREGAPLTGSISVDIDSGAAQYRLDSGETLNLAYREVDLDLAPGPDGIGVDGRLLLENGDTLELEGQLPGTYLLELDEGFRDLRATLRGRLEGLENIDALVPYVDALAGRLEFDLEIGGSLEQPILSGNASLSDARVNIPDADLAIGSLNLVAQADGRRNISYRANAEVLEGRFEASGEIRLDPKGGWPGSVSLQGKDFIPRGFLALWLPEEVDVDGRFDGSADLQFGAAIGLQGEVEIVSNRGVILYPLLEGELDSLDYHDASARVVVDESGISGESRVSTKEGISFAGRFELPDARLLDLDPDNQPVEGNARLEVQQLQLLQLLSFDIERPQGSYELDIEASGTLAKPRLAAQARLSDGEVGIPRLGIRVTGISMTGTTKENNRFDFAIDARSGEGYLRIEGSSVLDAASGWPTRIEINGNDFEAARIPEASVDLSPALVVVIEGRSIDISGDLRVPFARLQPRDITTAEKVSSDAVVIGGDEDVEPGWLVTTRVNLILGERVMFYGYGFDGRLTGRLLIEQQPGQLTSGTGEIGIPEGRYRAYGQRLDIENGRVLFTGGPVTNPGLDIRATRDSNGIITGLLVRGRLRQPQIELFSIPAMGQTDILSYLLFGRPLETASGEDSALMAQAALTLGLAGGDQIARSLRERFGLDDFRVETADSGDQASLIVGRYLSPDVYVSYAVGLIESANSLNLRYRITDHWQIEAESGTYHGADILYTIER